MCVDRGILFDIGIGGGDIGLRLVIIVVGDKVLNGIVREKFAHFAVELGGQGLVMRQDHGGTV